MIFALSPISSVYNGQEVSAQDLNNLSQNTELLEQIVEGPTRLFLSNWRMAAPTFALVNLQKQQRPDDDSQRPALYIKEVDVWEGSFIYREGMHTLRLGFQTYYIREGTGGKFVLPDDLKNIVATTGRGGSYNYSTSLFLVMKYTDVPIKQLVESAQYKSYVRSWVYDSTKNTTYKQPHNASINSFTFLSGATYTDSKMTWVPSTQAHQGYHTFDIDITDMKFVPGEIVQVKFKIATRDFKDVAYLGRRFYFSMVYANIAHNLMKDAWTTINNNSITLDSFAAIIKNQNILIDYLQNYDNPLRAGVWDQVSVGSSYFVFHSRWENDTYALLQDWGLNTDDDFLYYNRHAQQARYYTQRNWGKKDVISVSYSVDVNSKTAFTLQGILSASTTPATSYRRPIRLNEKSSAVPMWDIARRGGGDTDRDIGNPTTVNWWNTRPFMMMAGDSNFEGSLSKVNGYQTVKNIQHLLARRGYIRFIGTYEYQAPGQPNYGYTSEVPPTGISVRNVAQAIDVGEALFMKKPWIQAAGSFGGFYFVRPSPIDGGVAYFKANGGDLAGLSTDFFKGPVAISGVNTEAAHYSETFNFNLVKQSSNANRFYPNLYSTVFNGLENHPQFYITNDNNSYTDFSIDLREASSSFSSAKPPAGQDFAAPQSFDARAFNKASYISTIRISEVARKRSDFTVVPFQRFTSFQLLPYSGLINHLKEVNTRLNEIYSYFSVEDTLKYVPLFWTKPKSWLRHVEKAIFGESAGSETLWYNMEQNTVFFSNVRQADYLVVRGRNISIGWNGFIRVFRDNPARQFPSPLDFEFTNSQSLTGSTIETVVIGFNSFTGLHYGQRYFIQGEVFYAAETMGVP
jgi:hypothetical protein